MSIRYNPLDTRRLIVAMPIFYGVKSTIEASPYVPTPLQKAINTSFSATLAGALSAPKVHLVPKYTLAGLGFGILAGFFEAMVSRSR